MATAAALLAGGVLAGTAGAAQASPTTVSARPAPPAPAHRTFITLTGTTTSPGQMSPNIAFNLPGGSYGSPHGYSSYYDGYNGSTKLWTAPNCGPHNFGDPKQFNPTINDRLSSIDNNSPSYIDLYNWTGSWTYLGTVTSWQAGNLPSNLDNIVDEVVISC